MKFTRQGSFFLRKPNRTFMRNYATVEAFQSACRQLNAAPRPVMPPTPTPTPQAGSIRPALAAWATRPGPATVPAYAEHCCPNCYPVVDWSGVVYPYPYDSDELAPTGWNGVSTLDARRVTP